MNLLILTAVWLLSWISIIVIYSIANVISKDDNNNYFFSFAQNEMIADGNNLFSTGFFYLIGNIICKFINVPLIRWGLLIVGIVLCMPSIFSWFVSILPQAFREKDKYIWLMTITSCINTFVSILMALNIYLYFLI